MGIFQCHVSFQGGTWFFLKGEGCSWSGAIWGQSWTLRYFVGICAPWTCQVNTATFHLLRACNIQHISLSFQTFATCTVINKCPLNIMLRFQWLNLLLRTLQADHAQRAPLGNGGSGAKGAEILPVLLRCWTAWHRTNLGHKSYETCLKDLKKRSSMSLISQKPGGEKLLRRLRTLDVFHL